MILNLLLYISFFDLFILINANEQFHFGIINHQTQWNFHCPQNITKSLDPPSNDQPLISYECPHPSVPIEILPIEIDFTFLCRSHSRLIWIIIDLYQYNTYFWLLNSQDIKIKIDLNSRIELTDSKIELKNYTNRFIIINAYYIPFESIDFLLNQQIEINIQLTNIHQLNQCQYTLKDNYFWKTFLENNCNSERSSTLFIQSAQCDFYSNKLISSDPVPTTSPSTDPIPILTTTVNLINENPSTTRILSKDSTPYPHQHLHALIENHHRQILKTLSQSTNSKLLKLTFIFLLIILVILILFFLYMLCYHYYMRSKSSSSSSLIKKSSIDI